MRIALSAIASLVLIVVATLMPGDPGVATYSNCLICGDRGLADAILNLALFVPLGAALAFGRIRTPRILLAGMAVSMAVELLQLYIPGRDPSAGDLLFNTLGAALGAGAPSLLAHWRSVSGARADWWAAIWACAAAVIVLSSALLLAPALPRQVYYGQWTPDFANTERYRGRVVSAHIGDIRIRNGAIKRSEELRSQLLGGDMVRVRVIAGPSRQRNSPVFNIYDDTQHEVLSIIAEDEDLVIRYRMRATRLRLDQPTFTLRGALASVQPNGSWSLDLRLIDGGVCARVDELTECPLGFSAARGWSVLLHTLFPRWLETLLDVLWLAVLFIPAGSFILTRRAAVLPALLCVAGLLAANALGGLFPLRIYEVLAGLGGLLAGAAIRARVHSPTTRSHPSSLPSE